MNEVEFCEYNGVLHAIIVKSGFYQDGVTFLSPPKLSQQLAFIAHPADRIIQPHRHNKVTREVDFTLEVLVIKKGSLRVDFYSELEEYLDSRVLRSGDTILLANGAHGFEVLEELEMLEVKQGPYAGDDDKTRFPQSVPQAVRDRLR